MGQCFLYTQLRKQERTNGPGCEKGAWIMRGYFTASGYYGLVDGRYCLFASEADYNDYMTAEG